MPNQLPDLSDPFRAEFDYGGSTAENDNAFPPFINNTGGLYKSDRQRTGLLPEGSLEFKPITNFVFNQWNTRINKNFQNELVPGLAYRSMDAAYPDGEYALLAVAESVDRDPNEMFVSSPVLVGIDNFRPYLEDVKVFNSGPGFSTLVYHRFCSLNGEVLGSTGPFTETPLTNGEYNAVFTFSEQMDKNLISAWLDNGTSITTELFYDTATHKSKAEGHLSIYSPQDALVSLLVTSTDIAAKGLLELYPWRTEILPAAELTRDPATGRMQGMGGIDRLHSFRVEVSSPVITWTARDTGYSCPGDCGTEAAPINLPVNQARFTYTDSGSGLAAVTIYKDAIGGEPLVSTWTYTGNTYTLSAEPTLADGKYVQESTARATLPLKGWV